MQVMTDQSAVATSRRRPHRVARHSAPERAAHEERAHQDGRSGHRRDAGHSSRSAGRTPDPNAAKSDRRPDRRGGKEAPRGCPGRDAGEVQKQSLKHQERAVADAQHVWLLCRRRHCRSEKPQLRSSDPPNAPPICPRASAACSQNTFNYSSPEYQFGMTLSINLRNRQAKADQFRAVLQYRQSQITFEQQKKEHPLRRAQLEVCACSRRRPALTPPKGARPGAAHLRHHPAGATARRQVQQRYAGRGTRPGHGRIRSGRRADRVEKAKVDIDRAIGETLQRTGVSIDDAKSGVVTHAP